MDLRMAYCCNVLWPRLRASPLWVKSGEEQKYQLYMAWRRSVGASW